MSHNPDLSKTVQRLFLLWQRQVAAMSRSPEAGIADLMATYTELSKTLTREEDTVAGSSNKLNDE